MRDAVSTVTGATRTISEELARFSCGLDGAALPPALVEDATHRVLDAVGVGIAARRSDFAPAVVTVTTAAGGTEEATILGFGGQVPAPAAAFVNGALVSGEDFDDMHSVAMVHISSVVIPTLLAMGQRVRPSPELALTALVAGAEIGLRVGAAAPHRFILRGLHGTGVCGPFASAAVAARLLELDEAQTTHALGMAGSQSAGLMQGVLDGTWVKRLHAGWAAQGGITAALLAREGFTGPREVLEGRGGLYAALLGADAAAVDLASVTASLGQHWLLPTTSYKGYPSGAWTHASMDGVARLMAAHGIAAAGIDRIECTVPADAIPVVCEPRATKLSPNSPYHAKFSLPFSVALRAVLGHATLADYSEATLRDPRVIDLAARVECIADGALHNEGFPARVSIRTRDGERFCTDLLMQRGSPQSPMSREDHVEKFRANTADVLGERVSAELEEWITSVWMSADWDRLASLLAPCAT